MIEHCVSAFVDMQHEKFRFAYVADCLQTISESVAKISGGKYIRKRYSEIIEGMNKSEETRSAEEIIDYMLNKMSQGVQVEGSD